MFWIDIETEVLKEFKFVTIIRTAFPESVVAMALTLSEELEESITVLPNVLLNRAYV